jgi:DNA-binding MarR family transcriptional regulator/GNAT superfamily N-acetyltransferase
MTLIDSGEQRRIPMIDECVNRRAATVRQFNRFYTEKIGVLKEGYLDTPYPLAALRILFEIGDRRHACAADLARDLDLDQGYVSRLTNRLTRDGVITSPPAEHDRRQMILSLTTHGQGLVDEAAQRSQEEIGELLAPMPEPDQQRLVESLQTVARLLGAPAAQSTPVIVLRSHQPGDMGWIVEAHGAFYARHHGWDARCEALAAEIVAEFLRTFDPERDRCWIAERDGVRVGSVVVMRQDDETAKLRLLLVDPAARGLGLGRTLVRECIRFARSAGYRRLVLWTADVLTTARHIYEAEGFRLISQRPQPDFGPEMIGETWELVL